MKFTEYLNEKFSTAGNKQGKYTQIFVNPDQKEIKEILGEIKEKLIYHRSHQNFIRFGVDEENNVYAWDGNILHHHAEDILRKEKKLSGYFLFKFDYDYDANNFDRSVESKQSDIRKIDLEDVAHKVSIAIPKAKEPIYDFLDEVATSLQEGNKFKKLFMKEAPHTEYLDDEFIDFYRELDKDKTHWLFKVVDLYKNFPEKKDEITKHLLDDKFFLLAFKTDFNKLDDEKKKKLKSYIPPEFFINALKESAHQKRLAEKLGSIDKVKGVDNQVLLSLVKYMKDKGMKVDPLPLVRVIDNDEQNANELLGDTAGYDPDKKVITLYTMNRHPQDVFRSFLHELIHHIQNLEGRLEFSGTNNVNKDPKLEELEAEANRRATMIFRSWKDEQKGRE